MKESLYFGGSSLGFRFGSSLAFPAGFKLCSSSVTTSISSSNFPFKTTPINVTHTLHIWSWLTYSEFPYSLLLCEHRPPSLQSLLLKEVHQFHIRLSQLWELVHTAHRSVASRLSHCKQVQVQSACMQADEHTMMKDIRNDAACITYEVVRTEEVIIPYLHG